LGGALSESLRYRLLDHVADLGVEIWAPTLADLFVEAARSLFDLLGTLGTTRAVRADIVAVEGGDIEEVFHDWLSELLFRSAARRMVYSEFRVLSLELPRLVAEAQGEPFDPLRHSFEREIKAVTFHGLEVVEDRGLWRARVIFDV
jgi:SHS2 domain-containing protein